MRTDLLSIQISCNSGNYMKESNESYHIDERSQDIQNNDYTDENFVAMVTFSVPGLSKVIHTDGSN